MSNHQGRRTTDKPSSRKKVHDLQRMAKQRPSHYLPVLLTRPTLGLYAVSSTSKPPPTITGPEGVNPMSPNKYRQGKQTRTVVTRIVPNFPRLLFTERHNLQGIEGKKDSISSNPTPASGDVGGRPSSPRDRRTVAEMDGLREVLIGVDKALPRRARGSVVDRGMPRGSSCDQIERTFCRALFRFMDE